MFAKGSGPLRAWLLSAFLFALSSVPAEAVKKKRHGFRGKAALDARNAAMVKFFEDNL